ncbi:MAG: type II toxin-antitoxin system RelE/ParE family toxin [Legionellales bacterium]|nr:type II toxin-antitoxin system RelE/ParE family toxin [Legionellales bacterium]
MKIKIHQYISSAEINPFEKWFDKLNPIAAVKIATALYRLEQGNFSNVKSVGEGVFENKIDFGPGYRIYFGQEGDELIILLGGGTKKLQDRDIQNAKKYWTEYKTLKKQRK